MVLVGIAYGVAADAAEKKTLRLMHIQVAAETKKAVAEAVKRFEDATGAAVLVTALRNDPFKQQLAIELPSASPPDVFHTWGGGGLAGFVERGLVAPLPDDFPTAGLSPAALEFCKVAGKLYAVPADVSIVSFWYRKSVFAKHGLTPPGDLDGLVRVCAALRKAGVTPIALGNVEHWPGAFYFDYGVLRSGTATTDAAAEYIEKSNAAGAPTQTAVTAPARAFIRRLVDANAFNDGFGGINYSQAQAIFLKGDAAMILMGSWLLSYAISDRPEVVGDLGIFPFPVAGGGASARELLGGVNAAYSVSARCADKALAFKLIEFLTNDAAAQDWAKSGRIPARHVAAADMPAALEQAVELIRDAPRIQLYFDQALAPAVAEEHKRYTQTLFTTESAHTGVRLLVGLGAVLVLIAAGVALRRIFRAGV